MGITWSDRLAVGVQLIDAQHQELFDRVNKLLAALASRQGASEVTRLLGFLADYTVSHFGAEERLMQAAAYPAFEEHRRLHASFVDALRVMSAELARHGPSSALAVQLNGKASRWLLDHIGVADRALGTWLTARERSAA